MIYIKNYIDSVSLMDSRQKRELILSATDARALRDELAKLLAEVCELRESASKTQTVEIDLSGGKW